MIYPSAEEVELANRELLASWSRFLPSPGYSHAGKNAFRCLLEKEALLMHRILERLEEQGGMTPKISKKIDENHSQ